MAEFKELYSRPEIYDVVFDRDVSREVDFALSLFRDRNQSEACSSIEYACGPGYHSIALAKRGLHAHASDIQPEMISFAHQKAENAHANVSFSAQDMRRTFRQEQCFDVALTMLDGIDCLLTHSDFAAHLSAVAQALKPGGIYLIEYMHPRETELLYYKPMRLEGSRDGIHVTITYGVNDPVIDLRTQVAEVETETIVSHDGEVRQKYSSTALERFFTVQEVAALAFGSGSFQMVGAWGDFDQTIPIVRESIARKSIIALERNWTLV